MERAKGNPIATDVVEAPDSHLAIRWERGGEFVAVLKDAWSAKITKGREPRGRTQNFTRAYFIARSSLS